MDKILYVILGVVAVICLTVFGTVLIFNKYNTIENGKQEPPTFSATEKFFKLHAVDEVEVFHDKENHVICYHSMQALSCLKE